MSKKYGMNYAKIVEGIIVIVLAALLLADGVLGLTGGLEEELLSLPAVKLIVGLIALVLAGAFLEESRK